MTIETEKIRNGLAALAGLAHALLPLTLDAASGLFAHKCIFGEYEPTNYGHNPLYTAMALIGLGADEGKLPDYARAVPQRLAGHLSTSSSVALRGAATWAFASVGEERTSRVAHGLVNDVEFEAASSMDLGLALSGLAAAVEVGAIDASTVAPAATRCGDELLARLHGARCFRGTGGSLARRRVAVGNVTSFASQVYPLQGLAAISRALGVEAPKPLKAVAEAIVAVQGRLGQWWWFYEPKTGRVLDGYPVYSVHQDAMAFMALLPLEEHGQGRYTDALGLGLDWLFGKNELATPLVDLEQQRIARCIQRRGSDADAYGGISRTNRLQLIASSRHLAPARGVRAHPSSLEILAECRPYHLGWILLTKALFERVHPVAGSAHRSVEAETT